MMDSGTASWGTSADNFLAIETLGRTMTPAYTGPVKSLDKRQRITSGAENVT